MITEPVTPAVFAAGSLIAARGTLSERTFRTQTHGPAPLGCRRTDLGGGLGDQFFSVEGAIVLHDLARFLLSFLTCAANCDQSTAAPDAILVEFGLFLGNAMVTQKADNAADS